MCILINKLYYIVYLLSITMPNGDDLAEVPLSQQINKARKLLLKTLKDQLDDLVVTKLVEQEKGVPFIDFGDDPPQIVTIKKVINCLYHAEEGFKYYESVDKILYWEKP